MSNPAGDNAYRKQRSREERLPQATSRDTTRRSGAYGVPNPKRFDPLTLEAQCPFARHWWRRPY
ncbi:hypothetical protein AB0M44_21175 [Streptosporangium subroseum]|uniref:hypothetical protein n=1 Tax=Streptosporangium subroseum TaxID=106412 RepID=UPI00341A5258